MCALCDQEQETAQHLAGGCVFAKEVWYMVLAPIGLDHLAPQPQTSFLDWWLQSRLQLRSARCKGFDSHNPWSVVSLEGAESEGFLQ
jgi:hypothetical protein